MVWHPALLRVFVVEVRIDDRFDFGLLLDDLLNLISRFDLAVNLSHLRLLPGVSRNILVTVDLENGALASIKACVPRFGHTFLGVS